MLMISREELDICEIFDCYVNYNNNEIDGIRYNKEEFCSRVSRLINMEQSCDVPSYKDDPLYNGTSKK